jgi:phage/plasmid-like protein (TIGR03299 family)
MSAAVETMVYVREKPWHGLGVRVEEAMTSADAIRLAGLDWTIESRPVFDQDGKIISGYKANTRSSDGTVMGIVSGRYQIVQNQDAFDFTDSLIGEGIRYETAGSLHGGKKIWLLGRMPERYILGDKFEPYICFTNTHDGTGAVRACMTPVRVVCNNTLNLALSGAKRAWSTPHLGNIQAKLQEARTTLQIADEYLTKLDEEADRLANEKLSEGEVEQVITLMLPLPQKATERQKKTVQAAKDGIMACMIRPDIMQYLGTKYGFLNAVSDYVGHSNPIRQTKNYSDNRWDQIIIGHRLLDKAYSLVTGK